MISICSQDPVTDDDDLLTLILQRHLVAQVVDTVFYPKLVPYILANQDAAHTPYYLGVDTIANQLQEAGFDAEAVSLVASQRSVHPALRTFDSALGMLGRWFHR